MERIQDVGAELAALDAPWAARRPELIAAKTTRMKEGSFPFLRATATLFFARLREELLPPRAPELDPLARWLEGDADAAAGRISWCAGDVHVENFGAYKGTDGEERFGLNDFNDAVVAPVEVDVLRHATSVLVAARASGRLPGTTALGLVRALVETYARELASPEPAPELGYKDLPDGTVRNLLDSASERSRTQFIAKRAPAKKGKRGFGTSDRYRPLPDGPERTRVLEAFARAVAGLPRGASAASDAASLKADREREDFYRVEDVAARTAGLGSLGCGRYAVLVEGKGGDDGGVLLELKEAKPASLSRRPGPPLRTFEDEAARVVAGQVALRAGHAMHLGRTTLDGVSYYLRRLSHREQRVDLLTQGADERVLSAVVDAEARALARAQGRARRALGLGPFVPVSERERAVWVGLACRLAGRVEADYLSFCG